MDTIYIAKNIQHHEKKEYDQLCDRIVQPLFPPTPLHAPVPINPNRHLFYWIPFPSNVIVIIPPLFQLVILAIWLSPPSRWLGRGPQGGGWWLLRLSWSALQGRQLQRWWQPWQQCQIAEEASLPPLLAFLLALPLSGENQHFFCWGGGGRK